MRLALDRIRSQNFESFLEAGKVKQMNSRCDTHWAITLHKCTQKKTGTLWNRVVRRAYIIATETDVLLPQVQNCGTAFQLI